MSRILVTKNLKKKTEDHKSSQINKEEYAPVVR